MIASRQKSYLTPDEYFQSEDTSYIKHEYVDGQVYDMAGASDSHVTIALNLATNKGLWVLQSYTAGQASFRLDSVGIEATLAALYEDVSFTKIQQIP